MAFGLSFFNLKRKKVQMPSASFEQIMAEIAEVIIPRTDTPGGKVSHVVQHICIMIEFCISGRDKKMVIVGLNNVDEYSIYKYSVPFINCSDAQKISIVAYFQNKGVFKLPILNDIKRKLVGSSFFEIIKELTVNAYCFSEIGATLGMAYEHVPGLYLGCTSLEPGQHCWATT